MSPRPASLKVRAMQWLAQREHSRSELRDKLLRLLARPAVWVPGNGEGGGASDDDATAGDAAGAAEPAAEVEALLQWLESRGYLSQDRFIESRVHARQSRFGNLRIERELQQHGVVLDADTRQALRRSELQRAGEVWRKKYGAPASDAAGRLRQMRFLAGRGFSAEVVRRVLNGAGDESGD